MSANNTNSTANNQNASAESTPRRRMPNYVQIADAYIFQQTIDDRLQRVGVTQAREDNIRLAGVQWIDNVRKALKLPVRTFDTAVVYYHKFRLVHSDGEYSFVDAAAAALFAACKVEDTLKKSRDILCAAHNIKVQRADQLSPDDPVFEHQSRTIIGLERLMLEASGFDFRNRHPQHLLIKLAKHYDYTKDSPLVKLAYKSSLDLYRTFAPLKQSTPTLAFASLELAGRLLGQHDANLQRRWETRDYEKWGIDRGMVMETLLDLLELYTHYRTSTAIGGNFPIDTFLEVRIPLNEELEGKKLPRFTVWIDIPASNRQLVDAGKEPGGGVLNGHSRGSSKNVSPRDGIGPGGVIASPSTNSSSGPGSGSTAATSIPTGPAAAGGRGATAAANAARQRLGERGREGTVRFMLNPDREREERAVVAEYMLPGTANTAGAPVAGSALS